MSNHSLLDNDLFFKWLSLPERLILVKHDYGRPELSHISHFEISHSQAWVLSLLNGSLDNQSIAKILAEEFGHSEEEWEESIDTFTNELLAYNLIKPQHSPSTKSVIKLPVPPIHTMKPVDVKLQIIVVKPMEEIVEIYAGTMPTPT